MSDPPSVLQGYSAQLQCECLVLGGLCCKTIFLPIMRNIDSRTNTRAHH